MGRKIGAVSFLEILAPELNDRILSDILDLETGVIVNLHIHSIDQTEAIKTIKRKITDLDKMKIEEQKKAVRSGYDMDIIPSDLATFGSEAKNLLQDLQSRNERMFLLTFLVVNMADTKRKLENDVFAAAGIAQKNNCALTRLDYQQEAGLMSSVPLGENLIPIQRGLTTSSTAIFIPFITQELFQTGAALYYGLNALSNNMILCDRKQLKNPNGLILGTPGSGKSFAAKREMTNAFLITDDDIIICDPEAEYFSLVQRLDGQVIRLSPTGKGIDGKTGNLGDKRVNSGFQLAFPTCTRLFCLVLRIALSLAALAGDDNGQAIFPAQLVAHVPYAVIAPFVGIVFMVVYKVHRAKNDMVMDVSFVNVRREYILMLPLCYRVGKLLSDFMGFLIIDFPRLKGLYQMKG